jgi:hypothetical protein
MLTSRVPDPRKLHSNPLLGLAQRHDAVVNVVVGTSNKRGVLGGQEGRQRSISSGVPIRPIG